MIQRALEPTEFNPERISRRCFELQDDGLRADVQPHHRECFPPDCGGAWYRQPEQAEHSLALFRCLTGC